jgi:hypothetical protein
MTQLAAACSDSYTERQVKDRRCCMKPCCVCRKLHRRRSAPWQTGSYGTRGLCEGGRYYAAVIETLTEAGRTDLLHLWLGEPAELPDNGAYFQPAFGSAIDASDTSEVLFDVSDTGRPSSIALAQQPQPEREGEATRLMRKLRSVQFRPRWQGGFAQPVAQVKRRYVWLN